MQHPLAKPLRAKSNIADLKPPAPRRGSARSRQDGNCIRRSCEELQARGGESCGKHSARCLVPVPGPAEGAQGADAAKRLARARQLCAVDRLGGRGRNGLRPLLGHPWLAVPLFAIYGVLYASGGESRWHECSHGTSFRTRWINEAFYHLASFMALKNPYAWRWSHTRHHTDTIVVGRDPEIAFPRPPDVLGMVLNLLHLKAGFKEVARMLRNACGKLNPDESEYVPESERWKIHWTARAHVLVLAVVAAASVAWESPLPILMIGLPTFYGSWLHHLMATTQHAGLAENVPDHRLNTRTVLLNPVLRFIYSNMNYHVEHHMFPMVPFHALPALHEAVRDDMPRPYRGLHDAYREMIPALLRQVRDPSYFIQRALPPGARPTPEIP